MITLTTGNMIAIAGLMAAVLTPPTCALLALLFRTEARITRLEAIIETK